MNAQERLSHINKQVAEHFDEVLKLADKHNDDDMKYALSQLAQRLGDLIVAANNVWWEACEKAGEGAIDTAEKLKVVIGTLESK